MPRVTSFYFSLNKVRISFDWWSGNKVCLRDYFLKWTLPTVVVKDFIVLYTQLLDHEGRRRRQTKKINFEGSKKGSCRLVIAWNEPTIKSSSLKIFFLNCPLRDFGTGVLNVDYFFRWQNSIHVFAVALTLIDFAVSFSFNSTNIENTKIEMKEYK